MKTLRTEININATADKIWMILTNFKAYPEWNPFIKEFKGIPEQGKRFHVTIQPPDGKAMTFNPICLKLEENKEFRWLGSLLFKGVFDGEHVFTLQAQSDGSTLFIHEEHFQGILVPLLWKQLDTKTRKGFELMNQRLKELAEGT